MPYAFNYVDVDLDVTHDNDLQGDHGTHVSGIAAANAVEGSDVVGVAPDAQLIVMKVFGANGGAYWDDILAALEDCYRLNVDVVNLSLGAAAGFTYEEDVGCEVYARVLESDMILSVAAGNSSSAAQGNGYGTDTNLAEDPDNGIVSSPGTYLGATNVASLENDKQMLYYFTVNGQMVPYLDVGYYPAKALAGRELTYVMVPDNGAAPAWEGLDVAGKVAVVSRGGGVLFTDMQENAFAHGAAALIVYNNAEGALISMSDQERLPNVFVSKDGGARLAEAAGEDGEGTLVFSAEELPFESYAGGRMSDFSSWGATPDLRLLPDVTAPGGNIYSSVDGGGYGTMSGTSMAAPHIAGMSALVLQYLRDAYPDMTDSERHTVAEALIMSTAAPLTDPDGILYSPRKQGAGSANVYSAVTSPAYLTVEQTDGTYEIAAPKASLGDDDEKTGVYSFRFQLHNLSDAAQVYALDADLLTDQVQEIDGLKFMGETGRELSGSVVFRLADSSALSLDYDVNGDGLVDRADVQMLLDGVNGVLTLSEEIITRFRGLARPDTILDTADVQTLYEMVRNAALEDGLVSVPAGDSVDIEVTVTLSAADKQYLDENYKNGCYVEGFVRCYGQSDGAVDLSLPFLGFYGDWSAARVFDTVWFHEDPESEDYNRYPNVIFVDYGPTETSIGFNPYLEEAYDPAHNVLSPNGDGYLDAMTDMYLGLMRNAKTLSLTWRDAQGTELNANTALYVRKSIYYADYGFCIPMVLGDYFKSTELYDFKDENGAYLADGTDLTLTIAACLDDGDEQTDEAYTLPVHLDTVAPTLDTDRLVMVRDEATDTRTLSFPVSDNYAIAAVVPLTVAGVPMEYIPVEGKDGTIELDVTDYDSTFLIAVCDYGCNETYYEINFPGANSVNQNAFYGYRRFCVIPDGDYLYTTDALNGWYSFETADSMLQHTSQSGQNETAVAAAEYLDGYILGVDVNGEIFAMAAGDWNRNPLGTLTVDGAAYDALDMAFDYTTNTMYLLTDVREGERSGHLMKLDWQTGAVTDVGTVTGLPSKGVTLACDNEGILYTIDYETGGLYTI